MCFPSQPTKTNQSVVAMMLMTHIFSECLLFGTIITIAMHFPNQCEAALRKGSTQVFSIDLLTFGLSSSSCLSSGQSSNFSSSYFIQILNLLQESNSRTPLLVPEEGGEGEEGMGEVKIDIPTQVKLLVNMTIVVLYKAQNNSSNGRREVKSDIPGEFNRHQSSL